MYEGITGFLSSLQLVVGVGFSPGIVIVVFIIEIQIRSLLQRKVRRNAQRIVKKNSLRKSKGFKV
jgi:hypothetical protein